MDNPSLAFTTDRLFWCESGRVTDRGEYCVVETPDHPDYYFGNLLYFPAPPGPGDFERWTALFREAFAHEPRVRHMTFEWDVRGEETGHLAPFVEAGFEPESNVVLVARAVNPPPRPNTHVEVRPIREGEWEAVVENQVLGRSGDWAEEPYRQFRVRRIAEYQRMIDEGKGNWYGAFLGDTLVADLGLFRTGAVGRFQHVGTHPGYRRRGICGTLVHRVAADALASGYEALVMVADEHYHAARVYESVGFSPAERTGAVCRRPPESRAN